MSTSLARITPEAEREIGESIAVCASRVPAVTTTAGFDTATADLTDVKARQKRLEDLRKTITGPLVEAKRAVDALFEKPRTLLVQRETELKSSLAGYMEKKRAAEEAERRRKQAEAEAKARAERERLEAEARKQREAAEHERKKAEALQAKLMAERKLHADKAAAERRARDEARLEQLHRQESERRAAAEAAQARADVTVAERVEVRQRFDRSKGVSIRKVWSFRVVSFARLPDEYKLPNEKKLGELARTSGPVAAVPGVEFYEESCVAARAAS